MFVLLVELKIQPEHVDTFGRMVDAQAKHSVAVEEGCHQFDVCRAETGSVADRLTLAIESPSSSVCEGRG